MTRHLYLDTSSRFLSLLDELLRITAVYVANPEGLYDFVSTCKPFYEACNGKLVIGAGADAECSELVTSLPVPAHILHGLVPLGKPCIFPCPYPMKRTEAVGHVIDMVNFILDVNGRGPEGASPLTCVEENERHGYDDIDLSDDDDGGDDDIGDVDDNYLDNSDVDEPSNAVEFIYDKACDGWKQFMDGMTGPCMKIHDYEEKWAIFLSGGRAIPDHVTKMRVDINRGYKEYYDNPIFVIPSHINSLQIDDGSSECGSWIAAAKNTNLERLALTHASSYMCKALARAVAALIVESASTLTHLCMHGTLYGHPGNILFASEQKMPQLVRIDWYATGCNRLCSDELGVLLTRMVDRAPNLRTLNLHAPSHKLTDETIERITGHVHNVHVSSGPTSRSEWSECVEWLD